MKNGTRNFLLIIGLMFSLAAVADAPPSLNVPDSHSDENKGLLTLYRVQIKDLKFGQGEDLINTELFVTLDSTGDNVYTLDLHDDSPAVNKVIAETLLEAYLHDMNVTIYSSKFMKQGGAARIHMIQMDRRK